MAGEPPGEFDEIARLYRPLTEGSPEALDLLDDVAVLPSRPGFDLILTKDALVEGVHFLIGEPPNLVARKLLRTNLSDLAAKGAEPHGYLLAIAWPHGTPFKAKAQFAAGLAEDQARFGVRLLGGDTVSTSGPLTTSLTLLGWTPTGSMVRRAGATVGDILLVSGTIGDAGLGLARLLDGGARDKGEAALVARHRLPEPRLALRDTLRRFASAAADVSDGLIADAGHIAVASRCGLDIDLDLVPLSAAAADWVANQPDAIISRVSLATSGDDYEIVCTAPPAHLDEMLISAREAGVPLTVIGRVTDGEGVSALSGGRPTPIARTGWTHR